MINPQSRNFSPTDQSKDKLVHFSENIEILDAYGRQLVNVKKAPVIDFISCNAPMGEAIGLVIQELVKTVKTSRAVPLPVRLLERC